MNRKIVSDLQHWFQRKARKPLLLRGARQGGKATAVRLFCAQNKIPLLEINLEKNRSLDAVFATLNMKKILMALQTVLGRPVIDGGLLFLDEIQETPHAIEALRYFYEEYPQIPVIGAGSLLEMVLQNHEFAMPVGRIEFMSLGPMLFSEFLMAKGLDHLAQIICSTQNVSELDVVTHQALVQHWRTYLFVGGMPEAVNLWAETADLDEDTQKSIRRVQKSIVETYRADFPKYSRDRAELRVTKVYDYVPHALGEKIRYSRISSEDQSRDLKKATELLIQARVVLPVYHCAASGLPLSATRSESVYKLFYLDVGLVSAIQGLSFSQLERKMPKPLLTQGSLAEQFVAQHLSSLSADEAGRPELYYWLREGKTGNAEVDFIIQHEGEVVPLEVKSGTEGSLKSLHLLCVEKKLTHALRFDLNLASAQKIHKTVSYELKSMPIYAVEAISSLF